MGETLIGVDGKGKQKFVSNGEPSDSSKKSKKESAWGWLWVGFTFLVLLEAGKTVLRSVSIRGRPLSGNGESVT